MKKTIDGIEYVVYEAGMSLDNENESFYFENDLDYAGDVRCLHFYAVKNVVILGYQSVGGYQYVGGYQSVLGYQSVGGNQDVRGYQSVGGNQDVGGYQYVRFIKLYLFSKWPILIDRDTNNYRIGCVEKSESEWMAFFAEKQKINMDPSDRNYKKLETAFAAARVMRQHLIAMNDKPKQNEGNTI